MSGETLRELTQKNRARQLLLRKATVSQLRELWPMLDWAALDRTYPKFALAVSHLVQQNGNTSAGLSSSYLRAFRTAAGVPGEVKIAFPGPINPEQFSTTLRVSSIIPIKNAASAGTAGDVAMARARTLAEGAVSRMVLNYGRDTMMNTAINDPWAEGWQRVLGGAGCDFCHMLAGRGAVYFSGDTADFGAHDHCGCSAEIVYRDGNKESRQSRDYTPSTRRIADDTRAANNARARDWIEENQ